MDPKIFSLSQLKITVTAHQCDSPITLIRERSYFWTMDSSLHWLSIVLDTCFLFKSGLSQDILLQVPAQTHVAADLEDLDIIAKSMVELSLLITR